MKLINNINRIRGLIFGQAIGDGLGLASEFMTRNEVLHFYPNGIKGYDDIIQDKHRSRWQKGAWTDDTDQMLCILNSLLEKKSIDLKNIAQRFVEWKKSNGMGIGRHTNNILSVGNYADEPIKVAQLIWNMSGMKSAPNGAIMRTSIVGCWNYSNWEQVRINTENICKLTHYDPRCVGSCVIISYIVSQTIQDKTILKSDILNIGDQYDSRIAEYIELSYQSDVNLLKLDEESKIGYTLKTLSAALWAYNYAPDFHLGLRLIIEQGGDADTNGAVAGALLGLKFGYIDIPKNLKEKLIGKDILEYQSDQFINLICEN
ncbi:ADP-ribosylglycohydrolase family protein [Dysgonomonas sp. HDW5A]|uniref:ADP-ribosylglycohydrolase family protein n=1 Tax=Dysgonomonas sp. HDW5A TaxID=2714926 RepID=UPI00140B13F6|nr:ADP-ribosylglycohydrolase family protein [Dysgonomonas sp. HDW5A]QIK59901.1 ADP-ribosylglycohydrolase family protein [Dysgonomonas sp. HDW5A]